LKNSDQSNNCSTGNAGLEDRIEEAASQDQVHKPYPESNSITQNKKTCSNLCGNQELQES
jgi:hypothetical protein